MKYSLRSLAFCRACLGAIVFFAATAAWLSFLAWMPRPVPRDFVVFSLVFTTICGSIIGALFPWGIELFRKLL
jgi:hypothetical protein